MKKCRLCKLEKKKEEFNFLNLSHDKLSSFCKDCEKLIEERKSAKVTPKHILSYLVKVARRRAKEKGLECTIQPKDIEFTDTCPILKEKLVHRTGKLHPLNYSLDRIDSEKGYVPGNVKIISWKANNIKSNLTVEQIEDLLKYVKG